MKRFTTETHRHREEKIQSFKNCLSRLLCVSVSLWLFVWSSGCKSLVGKKQKPDLLEAELRTRERELLEARAELEHLRLITETYQRQPLPYTPGAVIHQSGAPPFALRDFQLGSGTGGRDDDGIPGDEGLQVVLVPKDDEGTAVKVPGRATITAFEITKEGMKLPIGKWEVAADQLKKSWKSGLLGGGYTIPLQWDRAPTTSRIRVVARFILNDGREYEADRDCNVTPLPGLPLRGPMPGFQNELPPPTVVPPICDPPAATLKPVK